MLIKLHKSDYSFQLILFFLAALILWVPAFIQPLSGGYEFSPAPFYNYFLFLIKDLPLLQVLIAFIIVLAEAYLLNTILIENSIIQKNTLLPAFVYLIAMSMEKELQTIYPALFSNLCIILVLYYILKIYYETEAYVDILNAGFLIGMASLFYLPSLFLLAALWSGLIILRIVEWREWIISIIGTLLPFLFLFTYYFWFDKLEVMMNSYMDFFTNIFTYSMNFNIYEIIILSILLFFIIISLYRLSTTLNKKTISIRKKSIIVIWFFLISLTAILYTQQPTIKYLALSFLSASGLVSIYFLEIKKKIVIEIILLIMVLVVFINRYFGNALL